MASEAKSAFPILASRLCDLENDKRERTQAVGPWRTGVESVDNELPETFWSSGSITGISEVRESGTGGQVRCLLFSLL